jgi:hypothetical protein
VSATDRDRYAGTRPHHPPSPGRPGMRRPRDPATPRGVVEHTLAAGDRLDALAQHYYGDPRRWWRILDANPTLVFGADLQRLDLEGRVIVIPRGDA